MNEVISEIVNEWSNNIPSGIIDHRNESHLDILSAILREYGMDEEVITAWVDNIANIGG